MFLGFACCSLQDGGCCESCLVALKVKEIRCSNVRVLTFLHSINRLKKF